MLKVAIVVPSWHYFTNPFKLQPLNELYFATVIDTHFQSKGVAVQVIDLRQTRLPESKIDLNNAARHIPEQDLYLYWIVKTADYPEISNIVGQLRRAYPKSKHVAGGTHVDNFSGDCQNDFDAIVSGAGEESFINAIDDLGNKSLKKIYSSDWKQIHYDNYPYARRHYLPKDSIVNNVLFEKYGGIPGTSAMFSRGCDFRCAYCVYNVPGKIQRRSPASIEEEINYLKREYGVSGVNLRDEICIPLASSVARPYLEAVGRCNVTWRGQTKVGASKEIITLARESGCVELAIGVESASQQVTNIINKGQTVKQAIEFMQTCKSAGIKIKMCLILGLPGEPEDIVDITRKFINKVKPDYVNISGFCPIPGSNIYKSKDYYGIKHIDSDWSKHAHLLFRFSDKEHFGIPFEYLDTGRWGKNFSRMQIIGNIKTLQQYLRECNMSY